MIEAKGISFSYTKDNPILEEISFVLSSGELLGVIGPNGAGKSTLIRCLNRILSPRKGQILLKGQNIKTYSRKELAKNIGYVPQKHSTAFPCKVIEVVMAGMGKPWNRAMAAKQAQKAVDTLRRLHMEAMALRDFGSLSGGEQQKTVIARVIAAQTPVMLFDEPTSNLDIRYQFETLKFLKQMVTTQNHSAVIAIHDLNMAMGYCDRILLLDKGRVKAVGPPEQVMTQQNVRKVFGVKTEFIKHKNQKILILKDAI